MQYNFEVRTTLSQEDSQLLVSDVVDGLESSSQLILELKVKVNTELPQDKVEALTQSVSNYVSGTLGIESEAQLTSKEN